MTAVAPQAASRLPEALDQLLGSPPDTDEQLASLLGAIQEACTGLVDLVQRGGRLHADMLENALQAVSCGLRNARTRLEAAAAAAAQLEAVRSGEWCQATVAAADACLHGEAWHAAYFGDAGADPSEEYKRCTGLAWGMLRDELLPVLVAAMAQQSADTGFCLAQQCGALLALGCTAAEVVGMRDARHRLPHMRSFKAVNALWNGIQRLWEAAPAEVRADMEKQGLGAAMVVGRVLRFFRADVRTCHQTLDPGAGQLLQYWLVKARFLLEAHPAAAPACWQGLVEVAVGAQRELALLLTVVAAAEGRAAGAGGQLVHALREQVIPKTTARLVSCLGWTAAEDQLRVMLDGLRVKLTRGSSDASEPAHVLRTVLHLLRSACGLPLLARHHCVSLLDSAMEALQGPAFAAALACGELREEMADAALVFLAACCHAAVTAPCNPDLQAWERQLTAQTWERCQQLLFRHALQPHPLTAQVLGALWSDLTACASEELLQSHIRALRDLLRLSAAAEAADAGPSHAPPSPLYSQLLGLLACLLSAAPAATLQAYYANFLQVQPSASEDACQLACLSAELRLALLVDVASGEATAAGQVQEVLASLYGRMIEACPALMRRLPRKGAAPADGGAADGEEECGYLACLLDAMQCSVAYFASTGAPQAQAASTVLSELPSRLTTLLAHATSRGALSFAAPALAALRHLHSLSLLHAPEAEQLVPVLSACLDQPELAGPAAELVPALAQCASHHADVVHAALSGDGPLLQHLGMEAFRLYAKTCPHASHVTAAVPPSARNPGTGEALPGFAAMLVQYTERSAGGSSDDQPGEQEAAAWGPALRQEALGAAAALQRAATDAQREEPAGSDGGPPAAEPAGQGGAAGEGAGEQAMEDDGGCGSDAVAAAAERVEQAVDAVAAAVAAAGGASLQPAAADALQRCVARLTQLLNPAPA